MAATRSGWQSAAGGPRGRLNACSEVPEGSAWLRPEAVPGGSSNTVPDRKVTGLVWPMLSCLSEGGGVLITKLQVSRYQDPVISRP